MLSSRLALPLLALIPSVLGCTPTGAATPILEPPPAAMPPPPGPAEPTAAVAPVELEVAPASLDVARDVELAKRISATPHAYFRFIAHDFARATCKRFAKLIDGWPKVVLHGDPHVEQYAVTDLGRGITDYDDAAVGPQVIDLVRMATSARLAARERGWADAEAPMLAELYRGYREGLGGPAPAEKEPRVVAQLREKFSKDKTKFLAFVDSSMVPIDPADPPGLAGSPRGEAFVRAQLAAYVQALKTQGADKPAKFFDVKKLGATRLGIGSALTRKYLVHVEGPGPAPEDDVVIEIKQVANLASIPCVEALPSIAVEQRVAEQAAAGLSGSLLTPVLLPERRFWVNEWLTNYHEVKIKKLESKEDLGEVVHSLGLAIAREHRKPRPGESAKTDPVALTLPPAMEADVSTVSDELAGSTIRGWERFKREVGAP